VFKERVWLPGATKVAVVGGNVDAMEIKLRNISKFQKSVNKHTFLHVS